MAEGFPPLIFIDVYKSRPPRYRGKARRQPWRWRAISGDNFRTLGSGEAYTNQADALAAVELLFGSGSNVYLRQSEVGDRVLRMATSGGEGEQ